MRFLRLLRSSLSAEAAVGIAVIMHASMIIARYFVIDLIIKPYWISAII
jgi:hypothetical protein